MGSGLAQKLRRGHAAAGHAHYQNLLVFILHGCSRSFLRQGVRQTTFSPYSERMATRDRMPVTTAYMATICVSLMPLSSK